MAGTLVMTGGGIKSATAAARYAAGGELSFVHLNYGQRTAKSELEAVRAIAAHFKAARVIALDLPHVIKLQEQVESRQSSEPATLQSGIVGARFLSPSSLRGLLPVLLSVGLECALRVGASRLVMGLSRRIDAAHLGLPTAEGRPDRLREILYDFNAIIGALTMQTSSLPVEAPLMDLTYAEVVNLAAHFRLPLEKTFTCDRSGPKACGRCDLCKARALAFAEARLADPVTTLAAV